MLRPKREACRLALLVGLGAGLAALAGCGSKGIEVVPVKGKVLYKGAPLPRGTVTFVPDETKGTARGHWPQGKIDAEGNYELVTNALKGAPTGAYQVTVNTLQRNVKPLTLIPLRYGDPKTSGLAVEVRKDPPPGSYDFELKP